MPKAILPAGANYHPAPRYESTRERVEQLAKAIDIIGMELAHATPAESRAELRRRIAKLSREAAAARQPTMMGALDRVARALDEELPPWVQGRLFE